MLTNLKIDKNNLKERLIFIGIFSGLLLPIRLLFNHYLNHYWLGTFGITFLVIFILFYFAEKDKLGYVGKILIKRVKKNTKGKKFKIIISLSIFMIYLSCLNLYGISHADNQMTNKVMDYFKNNNINNISDILNASKKESAYDWLNSFQVFIPSQITFISAKITNNLLDGYPSAFYTVLLAEEIEIIGLLFYLRFKYK